MTHSQLIARIQAKEDRERNARCRRIVRGIKGVMAAFRNDELNEIEAVVEKAYGRQKLNRR